MTSRPGSTVLSYAAVIGVALAIVVISVLVTNVPDPVATAPLLDTTIVAKLQTSGKSYPLEMQELLRDARANPTVLSKAKVAARALIAEGRNAGDSRLVGAATGVLLPFLAAPDAETLYLIATARQYQHDFKGALTLLDQAITLEPMDANALLTRATINIVLGEFELAKADCQRIASLPRPDLGFLCQSTALLLTEQAPAVYARLKEILAQPDLLDPALRGWAVGLLGEIAHLQGDDVTAKAHFTTVLADNPLALRERLLLVDILIEEKAANEAVALLEPAPAVDGVLIRRVLAARILGDETMADELTAELDRRFRLNLDLGLTAHAREETRYFLQIAGNPVLALERAIVNWNLQHEIEDAQLLIDGAIAANDPNAARPVLLWMAEQSVSVPNLRIPDSVRKTMR